MRRGIVVAVIVFSLLIPVLGISCGGTQEPEAEAWIGPEGGVLEVTNPESPAYGVRIEIPEGALEESVVVSISLVSGTPSEGSTEGDDVLSYAYGPVYDIDMEGASLSLAAVVRIPLPDDRGSEYGNWVIMHYSDGERQYLATILEDETLVAETTSFSWFSTEKVDEGFIKQKDESRKPVRFQYKQVGADEYVGLVDLDTEEEIALEDDVDWVFLEDKDDLWWLKLTAAMITGYGIPTHYLFEIGYDIVSEYVSHLWDVTGLNMDVYYEGCFESWEDSMTLGDAFGHMSLNLQVEQSRFLVQEGSGTGNFDPIITVSPTLTSDSPSGLQDLDDTALFFLFFHEGDCVGGTKSVVSSLSDFYIEVPRIGGSEQADPLQVFAVLVGRDPGSWWWDPRKVLAVFDSGIGDPGEGQYDLTISSSAGGSVTTPGEGTFARDSGTVVDLVAVADGGHYFSHWSGDVDFIADVNDASTSITMNGDYSITANFEDEWDIVIDTPTTWTTGTYTYTNVLITNNAALTLEDSVTIVCTDLTIDAGASISADGEGYPSGEGPGAGGYRRPTGGDYYYGSGAGHGGNGGLARYNLAGQEGIAYGSITEPVEPGSGGGKGGAGGGAIRLNVAGILTVDGSVSANGNDGNFYGGGGSGGSIYITTNTLTGSGNIAAVGGSSMYEGSVSDGGGGGGGRIALYYATSTFTGTMSAYGGLGWNNGGAGTIFIQGGVGPGNLVIDNNGVFTPTITPLDDGEPIFGAFTVSGKAECNIGPEVTLTTSLLTILGGSELTLAGDLIVPEELTVANSGHLNIDSNGYAEVESITVENGSSCYSYGGNLIVGRDFALENGSSYYSEANALSVPDVLAVGNDCTFSHSGSVDASVLILGDNSVITFAGGGTLELYVQSDLTIDNTASINADGRGYPSGEGPGAGGYRRPTGGIYYYGSGAGHGGNGGRGRYNLAGQEGIAYGSITEPVEPGSGGGKGGAGGGAIRLNVAGILTVDGSVSANGNDGNFYGGGGSGGSIYITTNTLTGSGNIAAVGGSSTDEGSVGDGGGGAGGRIALYYATSTFTGTMSVYGGLGYNNGEAGTIHIG